MIMLIKIIYDDVHKDDHDYDDNGDDHHYDVDDNHCDDDDHADNHNNDNGNDNDNDAAARTDLHHGGGSPRGGAPPLELPLLLRCGAHDHIHDSRCSPVQSPKRI